MFFEFHFYLFWKVCNKKTYRNIIGHLTSQLFPECVQIRCPLSIVGIFNVFQERWILFPVLWDPVHKFGARLLEIILFFFSSVKYPTWTFKLNKSCHRCVVLTFTNCRMSSLDGWLSWLAMNSLNSSNVTCGDTFIFISTNVLESL